MQEIIPGNDTLLNQCGPLASNNDWTVILITTFITFSFTGVLWLLSKGIMYWIETNDPAKLRNNARNLANSSKS
jgi:hypothetical protein